MMCDFDLVFIVHRLSLILIMFIALIGYRGCGKTAVAQLAALRLGWDWVDADVEIELRAAKSIAAIFADAGEQKFRDLESAMLGELIQRDRCAMALGGGVVLREENRRLLRNASEIGAGKNRLAARGAGNVVAADSSRSDNGRRGGRT